MKERIRSSDKIKTAFLEDRAGPKWHGTSDRREPERLVLGLLHVTRGTHGYVNFTEQRCHLVIQHGSHRPVILTQWGQFWQLCNSLRVGRIYCDTSNVLHIIMCEWRSLKLETFMSSWWSVPCFQSTVISFLSLMFLHLILTGNCCLQNRCIPSRWALASEPWEFGANHTSRYFR